MERVDALKQSVDQLSADSQAIRREMRRRTQLLSWLFVAGAVVLACALLAAYTVSLNNQREIAANNKRFCPMVALLINKPGTAPPTTERGLQIAEQAGALYRSFGCR